MFRRILTNTHAGLFMLKKLLYFWNHRYEPSLILRWHTLVKPEIHHYHVLYENNKALWNFKKKKSEWRVQTEVELGNGLAGTLCSFIPRNYRNKYLSALYKQTTEQHSQRLIKF